MLKQPRDTYEFFLYALTVHSFFITSALRINKSFNLCFTSSILHVQNPRSRFLRSVYMECNYISTISTEFKLCEIPCWVTPNTSFSRVWHGYLPSTLNSLTYESTHKKFSHFKQFQLQISSTYRTKKRLLYMTFILRHFCENLYVMLVQNRYYVF